MTTYRLTLSEQELADLRRCVWLTVSAANANGIDVGQPDLHALYTKLGALKERVCTNCFNGSPQPNGICDRCTKYKRANGYYP